MESVKDRKQYTRFEIANTLRILTPEQISEKAAAVEDRLCNFANFLESKIVLMYINNINEVSTAGILKKCSLYEKTVVLPMFGTEHFDLKLFKTVNLDSDLKTGARGVLEPDVKKCKIVPIDFIDIAIIPGLASDTKGGRIGGGDGYYDRLIPKLSNTTRKVALAFECQIIQQIPVEAHDRHVDIIVTEKRIIYKI